MLNATGVVLHTNLGRAPLAARRVARVRRGGRGYSNLEYDLESGERGSRYAPLRRAAARAHRRRGRAGGQQLRGARCCWCSPRWRAGREAVVSRGELVEIGGGFRIPDVMRAVRRRAGARSGTTNRTRRADYAAALSARTRRC